MSREQSKAAHYIQLLDIARCEGNWDAVPELVRKIRKHAPTRICLTLTAETEHAVTQHRINTPTSTRPSTAGSTSSALSKYIPPLLEAIANERQHVEDDFQARVCIGWIHWYIGEYAQAASSLPASIEAEFSQLDGTNKESNEWTKVCALKASFIKGDSQRRTGHVAEALETFDSALPILASISSTSQPAGRNEFNTWVEELLAGSCMLSSHAVKTNASLILETETLSAFRAWARFWEWAPTKPSGRTLNAGVSRRQVWKEYYITLSDILQQQAPFPTTALTTAYPESSSKSQQRAELRRVELRYEELLLSEVQFPKAEEPSEEVEAFVELVMQNWRILCGNTWEEHELGEGGAEAVSRGVLDILYNAATKTFHSTPILRHLFTVHAAVAEFDLAFKAFDTYLEIVKRGKARVEKTGELEHGLDDDETVLKTAAECIRALCRYGSKQGAEKANDLGHFFEEWLSKHHPLDQRNGNDRLLENSTSIASSTLISPKTLAMAWRSIGIGYAQWARLTFDASSRGNIQLKAIKCFRRALLPEYESTTDVETLFALGTILAERRELSTAIEVVKVGLTPLRTNLQNGNSSHVATKFSRERSLIPLWHLMALLLSARQDLATAVRFCEGVFDQFGDSKNLYGDSNLDGSFRSDHLNSNEKSVERNRGLVDEMDDIEKENLLEVKMTQLSLIEVLEGSEVAVNCSDELLSLYTRLFGDPCKEAAPTIVQNTTLVPPKTYAGTIRTMKGSIFGRSLNRSMRKDVVASMEQSTNSQRPEAPHAMVHRAPTIQVTHDNGAAGRHHHEKLHKKSSSRNPSQGPDRGAGVGRTQTDGAAAETDAVDREDHLETGSKPLPPASQQLEHDEPALKPPNSNHAVAPDNRLPITPYSLSQSPTTRFSKDSERRRRISTLVKVWLLIAGFYRRANMYEDAKGAIEEAHKLVHGLEIDILNDSTGLASFDHPGWGGGKSVAELWGDVFSERGYLFVDQSSPYTALENFEAALSHFADHPVATVGLSDILLDIYTEDLLPISTIPALVPPNVSTSTPSASSLNTSAQSQQYPSSIPPNSTTGPLGLPLPTTLKQDVHTAPEDNQTAQLDRLAARDRAYGLLSGLTKLGSGWNYSEAWYSLARAYEVGGQKDKAREVLWWCVELEEGRGLRSWEVASSGGYVL
ncbi:hypothetical protein MFRU_003g00620 [Monilinia fructicola]|uniref:Filamentation protein n=1 Tax=Monilinia fructicola TaxID=38448 RepID=A0A5M9K1Q0_MONFR|nr:hypothetical protein EYC84_003406 [Monilinia fructicola]KAG4034086.1 hypothetical protein MFRU_003g00620 [Monilinia fructicola]